MADNAVPAFAAGFGFTVMVLVAVVVPQAPPLVVNVKVITPDSDAPALYVAVEGLLAFVHVPAPPLQVPPVAPPDTEPPICADVPPWQIAVNAPPAFAVGFGFTVMVLVAVVVPHDPPLVVNVKVIAPDSDAPAVYVAVEGLLALVHVP